MHSFNCSYVTVTEMREQYKMHMREFERQAKYERNIVRSVPESDIIPDEETPTTQRWKPG